MRQEMMGFGNAVASDGPYSKIICTSLQTDNHTNTSALNFYGLDALPDAQRHSVSIEGIHHKPSSIQ